MDSMRPTADVEPIIRPDASLIEVHSEQNDLNMLDQNSVSLSPGLPYFVIDLGQLHLVNFSRVEDCLLISDHN